VRHGLLLPPAKYLPPLWPRQCPSPNTGSRASFCCGSPQKNLGLDLSSTGISPSCFLIFFYGELVLMVRVHPPLLEWTSSPPLALERASVDGVGVSAGSVSGGGSESERATRASQDLSCASTQSSAAVQLRCACVSMSMSMFMCGSLFKSVSVSVSLSVCMSVSVSISVFASVCVCAAVCGWRAAASGLKTLASGPRAVADA